MGFDNYKFVLYTCASSENEVTGEDIDLEDNFECDLKGVNLKPGVTLFSPRIEMVSYGGSPVARSTFPDFNFTVVEVHKDGIVLKRSFQYTSGSETFKISYSEPEHTDSFCFGRYSYSYRLKFVKRK